MRGVLTFLMVALSCGCLMLWLSASSFVSPIRVDETSQWRLVTRPGSIAVEYAIKRTSAVQSANPSAYQLPGIVYGDFQNQREWITSLRISWWAAILLLLAVPLWKMFGADVGLGLACRSHRLRMDRWRSGEISRYVLVLLAAVVIGLFVFLTAAFATWVLTSLYVASWLLAYAYYPSLLVVRRSARRCCLRCDHPLRGFDVSKCPRCGFSSKLVPELNP